MNSKIIDRILQEFSLSDQAAAISAMKSITLKEVMAESQKHLDNTWLAILKLCKGDLAQLKTLVAEAKQDFSNVLYRASLEH